MPTSVQVLSCLRVHQFCNNPSVPSLVELVNHDAVKPREFLYQANGDLKKCAEVGCGSQLF